MSYLRRFPIDRLKIDGSFIRDLSPQADDASIVQAIISLAHSLRLKVVAEGVETTQQLDHLKRLGCDQYQGFLASPAVSAAEVEALIRSRMKPIDATDPTGFGKTQSKLAAFRRNNSKA
jgi:EAL domain-containing protein (putative c-di-GMP-specific phosphodiesterase class I)